MVGRLRYSGRVDLAVVLTTFVVIFPAELPDKSLFASLVLGTRFRPLPVFCGVAALFAAGSVLVLLGNEENGAGGGHHPDHDGQPDRPVPRPAQRRDRRPARPVVGGGARPQRRAGPGPAHPDRLVHHFTAVVLAVLAVATLVEAVRS